MMTPPREFRQMQNRVRQMSHSHLLRSSPHTPVDHLRILIRLQMKTTTNLGLWRTYVNLYIYILSGYSPFSNRVGLPLHNIISPFPCHGHLICLFQVRPYPLLHSLTMYFLVFQPVFCFQHYTPYISSPSPHHLFSSHVHTISVYHL